MTIAAVKLTVLSSDAKPIDPPESIQTKAQTNKLFGVLKQIDAGVLNVGYAEAGPPDGRAVILLHGWPYDIYSYVEVAHLPKPSSMWMLVDLLLPRTLVPEHPPPGSQSYMR